MPFEEKGVRRTGEAGRRSAKSGEKVGDGLAVRGGGGGGAAGGLKVLGEEEIGVAEGEREGPR